MWRLRQLREFGLRLPVTGAVKCDSANLMVTSLQRGDPRAEMVIAYRLADVELVDLHAADWKAFHRKLLRLRFPVQEPVIESPFFLADFLRLIIGR